MPYGSAAQRDSVARKTAGRRCRAFVGVRHGELFQQAREGRPAAEAVTGDGDLVADVAAGRQTLDGLPDETLPNDLRQIDKNERKAYLDKNWPSATS